MVRFQTRRRSPKSLGTRTLNTRRWARGWKNVGWPESSAPGSKWLSGPTGTWTSSTKLRLKYPKCMVKLPSGFLDQPSKTGCTVWPVLYFRL